MKIENSLMTQEIDGRMMAWAWMKVRFEQQVRWKIKLNRKIPIFHDVVE